MKRIAFRAAFLIVCLIASSCDSFNTREISAENLDTLKLYQPQNQDINNSNPQLNSIRKFIGKRPSDVKLWKTEPLNSDLHRLLGKEYQKFIEIMENATPLREEKQIYTIGSYPDLSRIGFGYLIVDPDRNLLRAGIVTPGRHRHFGAKPSELETPAEIERKCKTIL